MVLDQLHVIHTETYMLPVKPKKSIFIILPRKKKKRAIFRTNAYLCFKDGFLVIILK